MRCQIFWKFLPKNAHFPDRCPELSQEKGRNNPGAGGGTRGCENNQAEDNWGQGSVIGLPRSLEVEAGESWETGGGADGWRMWSVLEAGLWGIQSEDGAIHGFLISTFIESLCTERRFSWVCILYSWTGTEEWKPWSLSYLPIIWTVVLLLQYEVILGCFGYIMCLQNPNAYPKKCASARRYSTKVKTLLQILVKLFQCNESHTNHFLTN